MSWSVTVRVLVMALSAACLAVVLDGSQSVSSERVIRLRFPNAADLQSVSIHYLLKGPFGGYGNFGRLHLNSREYLLETWHKGQPGTTLKGDRVFPGIPDRAFFGIFDGAMPSFTVATSAVNADGSFSLGVPDLARDPVVTSFDEGHLRGVLSLAVRESATGNSPYRLELMDRAGRDAELQLAPTYPQELMLVAIPMKLRSAE